jgi:hypothetical protein
MRQKVVDIVNIFFGMRKLIAWFALFLVAIVFRVLTYIDGAQFVDLMKSTFLGFVAGNSTEHLMTTIKEYVNSKGQPIQAVVASGAHSDDLVEGDDDSAPTKGDKQ